MDEAEKRAARRKRILENSEKRLQKITGRLKTTNHDFEEDCNNASCLMNNVEENKEILKVKRKDFLERENNAEIKEFDFLDDEKCDEISSQIRQTPKTPELSDIFQNIPPNLLKEPINDSREIVDIPGLQFLMNPISCVFLALFVNLLFFSRLHSLTKMGIVLPYLILALTKICFVNRYPQGGGSFLAVLILCNIKPEVVACLKKVMGSFFMLIKEFAVYLASFVILNWTLGICFANSPLKFK